MRSSGDPQYNAVMSIPGVNILYTTDEKDRQFAICDKMIDPDKFNHTDERAHAHTANINRLKRLNIFTKKNYNDYWKRRIDSLDFTDISEEELFDIDFDITFSIQLVEDIMKEFSTEGEEKKAFDSLVPFIRSRDPTNVFEQIETCNRVLALTKKQVEDKLKTVNEIIDHLDNTRIDAETDPIVDDPALQRAENEYRAVLAEYNAAKQELSRLTSLENNIVEEIRITIKDTIHSIIQPSSEIDAKKLSAIKNIITKSKLKNIIKSAIAYGRLSFHQLVILFRGLKYIKIYIVDPSCFTLEPIKYEVTRKVVQVDTQTLSPEEDEFVSDRVTRPPLSVIARWPLLNSDANGGTIRNKSRKRRTRKNRHITRRRRR
jgi:hypothetical protein